MIIPGFVIINTTPDSAVALANRMRNLSSPDFEVFRPIIDRLPEESRVILFLEFFNEQADVNLVQSVSRMQGVRKIDCTAGTRRTISSPT